MPPWPPACIARSAPYVGYYDADLSTPPSAVTLGIDLLHSGWQVVIGSRRCNGAGYSVPQGHLRRVGGFAFRVMTGGLNGPITDTQCGFKLFQSAVAKELFSPALPTGSPSTSRCWPRCSSATTV